MKLLIRSPYNKTYQTLNNKNQNLFHMLGQIKNSCRINQLNELLDTFHSKQIHLDVKDIYIDDAKVIIYRNENKDLCVACKGMIDAHVAKGIPVFGIEAFKQWVKEQVEKNEEVKEEVDTNVN
jgi:hypothetical protein